MKYIWPPLVKALDERAEKISHGLAAAENAKTELSNVHREVETKLAATRSFMIQSLSVGGDDSE